MIAWLDFYKRRDMVDRRDARMDILKGLLVVGMVYCHVLQFFGAADIFPVEDILTNFVNIVTFSGFVFVYGYLGELAYFEKGLKKSWARLLRGSGKAYLAFVISGATFRILREHKRFSQETILGILGLRDIPGWSEFLIAFALIPLVALILWKPLNALVSRKKLFWVVAALLPLTGLIPYERVGSVQLGLLVGGHQFAFFPVLQYFFLYLLGMYFRRHRVGFDWRMLAGSALLTGGALAYTFVAQGLPGRFPPTPLWLVMPLLPLYLYFLLATGWASARVPSAGLKGLLNRVGWKQRAEALPGELALPSRALTNLGRNSLFYLLGSNLTIFVLAGNRGAPLDKATGILPWKLPLASPLGALCWTVVLLLGAAFLCNLPVKRKG